MGVHIWSWFSPSNLIVNIEWLPWTCNGKIKRTYPFFDSNIWKCHIMITTAKKMSYIHVHSSTISLYETESIVSLPKDQSSTIFTNKFLMEGIATVDIIRVAECVIFPFNIVHSCVEELPRSDRSLNGNGSNIVEW